METAVPRHAHNKQVGFAQVDLLPNLRPAQRYVETDASLSFPVMMEIISMETVVTPVVSLKLDIRVLVEIRHRRVFARKFAEMGSYYTWPVTTETLFLETAVLKPALLRTTGTAQEEVSQPVPSVINRNSWSLSSLILSKKSIITQLPSILK